MALPISARKANFRAALSGVDAAFDLKSPPPAVTARPNTAWTKVHDDAFIFAFAGGTGAFRSRL